MLVDISLLLSVECMYMFGVFVAIFAHILYTLLNCLFQVICRLSLDASSVAFEEFDGQILSIDPIYSP